RASGIGIRPAGVRLREPKPQDTRVDALPSRLQDAGSIPAASTIPSPYRTRVSARVLCFGHHRGTISRVMAATQDLNGVPAALAMLLSLASGRLGSPDHGQA